MDGAENPNRRTSADWERAIKENVPKRRHCKVACAVWWDYCEAKAWGGKSTPWFREMVSGYRAKDEIPADRLEQSLRAIGYPDWRIKAKITATWLDRRRAEKAKENQ